MVVYQAVAILSHSRGDIVLITILHVACGGVLGGGCIVR